MSTLKHDCDGILETKTLASCHLAILSESKKETNNTKCSRVTTRSPFGNIERLWKVFDSYTLWFYIQKCVCPSEAPFFHPKRITENVRMETSAQLNQGVRLKIKNNKAWCPCWTKTGSKDVWCESLPKLLACNPCSQFMNCVYPSAPVTITSIQILMASAEGATM